ncbi:MAG: prolipoprotein diacylglyceryl transferase, partial [Phycisphaeraceae bacterium]|nr:prolipoprotein diacylglyceryl transferase [Phycisphaeraceae bacterium]
MLTLAVYLHNIDRFAIRIWPDGPAFAQGIRWYGLAYLAGFVVGYLLMRRIVRVGHGSLNLAQLWDFALALALGAVIGGRLGYVIFYEPSLLWDPPIVGVFQVWRGGMASHGGLIGIVTACAWFARRQRVSFPHLLDMTAWATPVGLFFGRLANFVNGDLWGRMAGGGVWWAVQFPQELATWGNQRLINLAERMPAGLDGMFLRDPEGFALRQVHECNADVIAVLREALPARHPSQLYEAVLEGVVVFVVLALVWVRPRRPGVLAGSGMVTYAVVRIVGEFFREPDAQIAHLEAAHWGVTRGQLLSAVMAAAGAGLL